MRSIKHLLARAPVLSPIADLGARQAFWLSWLGARLPENLAARVTGTVQRGGLLTVFAESAAWSARLRYALQELDAALREADPNIKRVSVKVMPGKSAARP
jgi:predicted nucleic acid-binding Zn ribbon protein